jgi:hypothetical protein
MLSALTSDTLIPFHSIPVHHRIKYSNPDRSEVVDSIQVRPEQKDSCGRRIPSQFDTALVSGKSPSQDGLVHGVDGKYFKYKATFPTSPLPRPSCSTSVSGV